MRNTKHLAVWGDKPVHYRKFGSHRKFAEQNNYELRIICTATFIPSAAADIIPPA